MEIRRTLILIALAVTSYFMFLTWQRDYASPQQTTAASQAPVSTGGASVDLPAAPNKADLPAAVAAVPAAGATAAASDAVIKAGSDVLAIEIDPRGGDLVKVALPAYKHSIVDEKPFVLLDHGAQLDYIAQSGLVRANASGGLQGLDDQPEGRPLYRQVSADTTLKPGQDALEVVLEAQTRDGIVVRKTYRLVRGDYRIGVRYDIRNGASQPWSGVMFGQIKRNGAPDPGSEQHSFGMVTFLGGAWWTPEQNYNKVALDSFAKNPVNATVTGGWVALVQHYFVSAWVPAPGDSNTLSTRVSSDGRDHFIGFTGKALTLQPGASGQIAATFYAGPKIQDKLKALSPGLELTVDYGWLWPIAQFLFWLLKSIHGFLGNWGWSIVMLTILVKGAFFHLSATSYRSMANMRRVMPEMQRMKEQHGNDRAKLSQAMMELYKKEKINPLGGCLPILVQMPVFIALYWTLMESVELRHAPWVLWIKDLSAMDPYFILPLLMGVTMFVQQSLNPAPQDPTQAKVMKFMPVVFTVFFLWFPAGLVLYWLVNNLLSIAQQWVITRQIEAGAK